MVRLAQIEQFPGKFPSGNTVTHCQLVANLHVSRFGDRAFAAAGPQLWNSLPAHIRQPALTLDNFLRQLKMYVIASARGTSA